MLGGRWAHFLQLGPSGGGGRLSLFSTQPSLLKKCFSTQKENSSIEFHWWGGGWGGRHNLSLATLQSRVLSSAILRDLVLVCTHHMLHQVPEAANCFCHLQPHICSNKAFSFHVPFFQSLPSCVPLSVLFHLSSRSPCSGEYQTTFVLTLN